MTTLASLVLSVRQTAALHPQDFGWHTISQFTDFEITEILRDQNCTEIVQAISAFQQVANALNEDG